MRDAGYAGCDVLAGGSVEKSARKERAAGVIHSA